jgi:hypothetical protein
MPDCKVQIAKSKILQNLLRAVTTHGRQKLIAASVSQTEHVSSPATAVPQWLLPLYCKLIRIKAKLPFLAISDVPSCSGCATRCATGEWFSPESRGVTQSSAVSAGINLRNIVKRVEMRIPVSAAKENLHRAD